MTYRSSDTELKEFVTMARIHPVHRDYTSREAAEGLPQDTRAYEVTVGS